MNFYVLYASRFICFYVLHALNRLFNLNSFSSESQAPKKAKKKEAASSNVFSMFEQSQIQEFKEVGHF